MIHSTLFDRLVWTVAAVLTLASVGLYLVSTRAGVAIRATWPDGKGEAPGYTDIGIEFAEPMDPSSVESRFHLDPEVEGELAWEGNRMVFRPSRPMMAGGLYRVRVDAGARSTSGQVLKRAAEWSFRVRQPYLLFFSPAAGDYELYRQQLGSDTREQLTHTQGMVREYAVSSDGRAIAFVRDNDQAGSDLWLLPDGGTPRLLVACGEGRCTGAAFSPDGRRLAFSRDGVLADGSGRRSPPRIWIVSLDTGSAEALFEDSQVLGFDARWSPDGARLAFYDGGIGSIRIVSLQDGSEIQLESQMGLVGSWSPDGQAMLFPVLLTGGGQPTTELRAADLAGGVIRRWLGAERGWVDLGVPAWSPDGDWVAVAVQPSAATPSREVWLLRPDASEAHALLATEGSTYGGIAWAPQGGLLAYQTLVMGDPGARPSVMTLDLATGAGRQVAADAWRPGWQP